MSNLEEELKSKGRIVYTNKGNSMSPLIKGGRDVLVIRAKNDGFRKNDVVLYKTPKGQLMLHRIRKTSKGHYFIIGDHCTVGETVPQERVIGILESLMRGDRTVKLSGFSYKLYVVTIPLRRAAIRIRRKISRK